MRHALGVLGVMAAGVLLAVSAAMNWRFGYQLGTTELDGLIYGSASAAADCLKALVPFFIFAAIRNRMWSQAAASAVVWLVVTAYSLTSALGHAALNRQESTGQRAAQATAYQQLTADLKRAQQQLSWVPQHRPAATVMGEMSGKEAQRYWKWSNGCTTVRGSRTRRFCQQYNALKAELGSANQAAKLEQRIAASRAKLAEFKGAGHGAADPQAHILAKLTGAFMPGISVEDVQMALAIFIALLLEVGSGLGLYIAFSQWRLNPVAAAVAVTPTAVPLANKAETAVTEVTPVVTDETVEGANDNPTEVIEEVANETPRLTAPQSDVERYHKERIECQDGSSLTATDLYEDYCAWCEEQDKEPLALPTFGREFGDLGVQKAKIAGRVRYIGVALHKRAAGTEDKNVPAFSSKAA
ncbi:MAG: hypothetical protein AAGC70_19080 [Pseudomonadota bacterium]